MDDLPNTDRILYLLSAGASYQIICSLLYVALMSILYSFQGFLVVESVIHVTYVMKNKKVTKWNMPRGWFVAFAPKNKWVCTGSVCGMDS